MSLFDTKSLFPLKSRESVYSMIRFPIQPASGLLKRDSCQNFLETLQIILPKSAYAQHYYPAIERFVNYVQILPARQQGLFSEIEGLLNYSLSRATYTLTTGLSYLYPDQKDFYKLKHSSIRSVELYAAFTAALFKDINLLAHDYEITLYDQDEKELPPWKPFESSIVDTPKAAFLSFRYVESAERLDLSNGCLASVILATHPKTRPGFLSITQHPDLLETWLATLADQTYRVPPEAVIALLPFGEKQAVDKRLEERLELRRSMTKESDLETEKEKLKDKEKLLGEKFLNWLRERAERGKLAINAHEEIGVRRTQEGILIARGELLAFSELNGVDPEKVEQQFKEVAALYPASVNERARQSGSLGGVAQAALGQWLLAHNPALVFSLGRMPPIYISSPLAPANLRPNISYTNPIK